MGFDLILNVESTQVIDLSRSAIGTKPEAWVRAVHHNFRISNSNTQYGLLGTQQSGAVHCNHAELMIDTIAVFILLG